MARFLGLSTAASVYGTASSLAVVLLWIYYSAMIFLLGVEIIKVWRRPAVLHHRDRTSGTSEPAPNFPAAPGASVVQATLRPQTG